MKLDILPSPTTSPRNERSKHNSIFQLLCSKNMNEGFVFKKISSSGPDSVFSAKFLVPIELQYRSKGLKTTCKHHRALRESRHARCLSNYKCRDFNLMRNNIRFPIFTQGNEIIQLNRTVQNNLAWQESCHRYVHHVNEIWQFFVIFHYFYLNRLNISHSHLYTLVKKSF